MKPPTCYVMYTLKLKFYQRNCTINANLLDTDRTLQHHVQRMPNTVPCLFKLIYDFGQNFLAFMLCNSQCMQTWFYDKMK